MVRAVKLIAPAIMALFLISCSIFGVDKNQSPILSQSDIPSQTDVTTITPTVKPTAAPQPPPNLIYEDNSDTVILTIQNIGIQMEFPLEFQHVITYYPETWCINFDFSKEPFNGEYSESCSSCVNIDFQAKFDINSIQEVDESYTTEKAEDGTDIYIMNPYDTGSEVGFTFAREDISCWGDIRVSPAFYRRYEDAIMNMIKTMKTTDRHDIAVPTPQPINLVKVEYRGWNLLPVPSFGAAVYVPEGFDQVCTFSCKEDFASVSFDFTKPPFNEPISKGYTDTYTSSIDICFYRGIKKKYPDHGHFITYSYADSNPYLILIGFLKTDKAVNFEAEDLHYEYGGIVSVSREFYDKYEIEILEMLKPWPIEATQ